VKTYIIVAAVSYLLGSIPFGYILVKLFLKQDIRATGSGNIGATNVARSGAKGLAIATLVLDAGKGALAVILGKKIWMTFAVARTVALYQGTPKEVSYTYFPGLHTAMALAAFCAVLGHIFPIWLKFKGGKGVATAVGAFALISPSAVFVALFAFVIVVAATRYVSLGSMIGSAVFVVAWGVKVIPPYFPITNTLILSAATSILIILKHHENIRRLLAGTENKFGGKKSVPPPDAVEKQA